ncbi:response regulator transcription factor [Dissulfurirhabdus thermomarina]|uniref:Response regulator transcription factor n=1 Tax=Dissulfurirhabdus thermomarina TaxID=1765737 RepID=A0A6N9TS60_DISTH|nr:response regulator transcription factor [Dissulfurirhabdus thermomarina]NDY42943.1 response regulator transcription factor [Dissulfurirhabdus thermomarina]NMX22894.1 response regulator transcription factor [Dissulfurirhabdus thermomarina]
MKILVVEDDRQTARYLAKGLREAGCAVVTAADGPSGLERAREEVFDCLVVDVMLPGIDGLSLVRSVRRGNPSVPILILSARGAVEDKVRGLEDGADDYLSKPFSFSELLARVRALVRRGAGQPSAARIRTGDLEIDLAARRVSRAGRRLDLMPKEFDLLVALARNAGRVLTRTQILEHVWGYLYDAGTNVVDVHICRLRNKVDRGFASPLIHTIRGVGYVLRDEP